MIYEVNCLQAYNLVEDEASGLVNNKEVVDDRCHVAPAQCAERPAGPHQKLEAEEASERAFKASKEGDRNHPPCLSRMDVMDEEKQSEQGRRQKSSTMPLTDGCPR